MYKSFCANILEHYLRQDKFEWTFYAILEYK